MKLNLFSFISGFTVGGTSYLIANKFRNRLKNEDTADNLDESSTKSILKYGTPISIPSILSYSNHVLSYNTNYKIPIWVGELLTRDNLKGDANRKHSKFKPDINIPDLFNASNNDYLGSGWSRGHMAPAGDNKASQLAMDESFYLSNILPQNYENNAGFWNRFEIFCRDLTDRFDEVRVFSGPLFLPVTEENKSFIKFQVIGKNSVAVPTHLYKVIVAENKSSADSKPRMGAFIVPNAPIPKDARLVEYSASKQDVTKLIGRELLPNLPPTSCDKLCRDDSDCELISVQELSRLILIRRIQRANNLEQLEKLWSKREKQDDSGTVKTEDDKDQLTVAYLTRLDELKQKQETDSRSKNN